jgi:hypothetical protein
LGAAAKEGKRMSYPLATQIPMIIEDLADQDPMIWSNSLKAWTNGSSTIAPGTVAVITDGVTIEGNGLTANPIKLVPVLTNTESYYGGLFNINSYGQIVTNPIVPNYQNFGVQFSQLNQNMTNATMNGIVANNLSSSYETLTSPQLSSFNTGSGVYGCGLPGGYAVSIQGVFAANSQGIRGVGIWTNTSLQTATPFGSNYVNANASGTTTLSTSATVYCLANDTIQVWGYQNSGATVGGTFTVSISYVG